MEGGRGDGLSWGVWLMEMFEPRRLPWKCLVCRCFMHDSYLCRQSSVVP
jgi:hypothetical protein